MLKMFSLLVTMSLVSGCALRGEYRGVAYAIDGTMFAAGAALAMVDEPSPHSEDTAEAAGAILAWPVMAANEVGVGLMAIGLVAGVVNYMINDSDGETRAGPTALDPASRVATVEAAPAPLPELPGSEPDAVLLAQRARVAALGGQCDVVRRYADRVVEIDERYYVRVFSVDPSLRACL